MIPATTAASNIKNSSIGITTEKACHARCGLEERFKLVVSNGLLLVAAGFPYFLPVSPPPCGIAGGDRRVASAS